MQFFRQPVVDTVRKRFAWLPRKICLVETQWISTEQAPIQFFPNWWHTNMYPPGFSGRVTIKSGTTGGMVQPVEQKNVNHFDCWIWLEHYLEIRRVEENWQGNKSWWAAYNMPKQWNLWHEY